MFSREECSRDFGNIDSHVAGDLFFLDRLAVMSFEHRFVSGQRRVFCGTCQGCMSLNITSHVFDNLFLVGRIGCAAR